MLVITEDGFFFSIVTDRENPELLWARSQDLESIQHLEQFLVFDRLWSIRPQVIDEPTWDYQYRIKVRRDDLAAFLKRAVDDVSTDRIKPAVAAGRGADHPITHAVSDLFFTLSENRPDGSKPAWMTPGATKR